VWFGKHQSDDTKRQAHNELIHKFVNFQYIMNLAPDDYFVRLSHSSCLVDPKTTFYAPSAQPSECWHEQIFMFAVNTLIPGPTADRQPLPKAACLERKGGVA
jgi:hypothetical protein